METIAELISRNAQPGRLEWIGIRPQRRGEMLVSDHAMVLATGLEGDHYASGGKRSVTLIQKEHLAVIASLLGTGDVAPQLLRRNLVAGGINLLGLRNRQFRIGNVLLEGSGLCAPCSRMEEIIGFGGYSAVRGHGGITARIITPGRLSIGDPIIAV